MATFYIVYSVVAVAELLVLAAIHPFPIHPVEPKWLHLVDPVVALVQAVELKWLHRADQVVAQHQAAAQAAVPKSLRAVRLLAAVKARAVLLDDPFFLPSRRSYAV